MYTEREWSSAPSWLAERGYHLLAFDTIESARKFARNNKPQVIGVEQRIYRCMAEGIKSQPLPHQLSIQVLESGKFSFMNSGMWPNGTVMAEKLMPIKEIDDHSI
jgi:hypothetical protein